MCNYDNLVVPGEVYNFPFHPKREVWGRSEDGNTDLIQEQSSSLGMEILGCIHEWMQLVHVYDFHGLYRLW